MKNKTKIEAELAVTRKLREAVNYQEEFEWVESEIARLEAELAALEAQNESPGDAATNSQAASFLESPSSRGGTI